jgi:hypothetical protein
MAAIEMQNVTKKFATADGGTYTALRDITGVGRSDGGRDGRSGAGQGRQ